VDGNAPIPPYYTGLVGDYPALIHVE
jgi:hypothetical protein